MTKPIPIFRVLVGLTILLLVACSGGSGGDTPTPAPGPDFALTLSSPNPVGPGGSTTAAVTATRSGGHAAAITLSLLSNAQGITGSGSIAASATDGTLTISVPSGVAAGTYALTVRGDDGSLLRSTSFNLVVTGAVNPAWSSPFGFHPAIVAHPGYPDSGFTDARNLGVTWTRGGGGPYAFWFKIQPDLASQTYDFTESDRGWQNIPAGFNVLWNIAPQGPQDEGRCLSGSFFPVDEEKYVAFVKAVVQRYCGDGVHDMPGLVNPIKVWQVGNEPLDLKSRFADLQRITYTAIKEVCPDCTVLIGGVPGMPPAADYLATFDQHYRSILDGLGGKYVDVMDFHWYGAATGDYRGSKEVYDHIRAVLRADGFPEIPIWITEMGAYSGAPIAPPGKSGAGYPLQSEQQQAGDYFKRFVYPLSFGVKKVFPAYGLMEGFKYDGGYFDFTGLIYDGWDPPGGTREDLGLGVKKLGYYTYKKMTEVLEGADWEHSQIIRESGNIRVYKFSKPGKEIYAAWWDYFDDPAYTPGATVTLALSGLTGGPAVVTEVVPKFATGKEVAAYADAFNSRTLALGNGNLSLDLGENPVLIEIPQ